MLSELDKTIPQEEADRLAWDLWRRAQQLNVKFSRTTSPKFHNFFVNVGLKEKGLCYHYSDALYRQMSKRNYPHFAFHLAGANIGSFWFEHNALVVTAKGSSVEDGLIIDAWRDPHSLYAVKFKCDSDYNWIHRPNRGCRQNGK